MRRRSNLMVLFGIAFFIVGGVVVYLVTRDSGTAAADRPAVTSDVTVVVATEDIPSGALGSELRGSGAVEVATVAAEEAVAGALTSLAQLDGTVLISPLGPDQQITRGDVQGRSRNFEIPDGLEAVAVQIDFVAAGAGYVRAGDRINLYGVLEQPAGDLPAPRAQLLLADVEVLEVSDEIASRRGSTVAAANDDPTDPAPGRAATSSITYLLALTAADAEKLIFATSFEGLHVTLVGEDAPPVGPTPGRDGGSLLQ